METLNCRFGSGAKQNRSYHYIQNSLFERIIFIAITFFPFLYFLFLENGVVSQKICEWAGSMMSDEFGVEAEILEKEFIPFFRLKYLSLDGCLPSKMHVVTAGIVCFVILISGCFIRSCQGPLTIFGMISVIIMSVSVIYFYFFGDRFPYTLTDYSGLYMTQQIVSWLAVGLILSLVLALYSKAMLPAILTYYGTLAYCFVIGCLRYMFYLSFLHFASSLYMAILFFTVGVFWDFLFVVCTFSMFTRKLSIEYKKRGDDIWQC